MTDADSIHRATGAPRSARRRPFGGLGQDFRHASRVLRRSPGFAAVIVLSLGTVIGATTALFGLADAMFLRRLPLPNAEQLVAVTRYGRRVIVRRQDLDLLRAMPGTPRLEGYRFEGADVAADSDRAKLWVDAVTGGYFNLLGMRPAAGRSLTEADERAALPVAVVSDHYWTTHMGGRSDAVGRTITLNGLPFTVVGVMPPEFTGIHFARQFDVAIPFSLSPSSWPDPRRLSANLIGRLDPSRPRVTQAAALRLALERCCIDADRDQPSSPPAGAVHLVPVPNPPVGDHGEGFSGAPGLGPPIVLADASQGLVWNLDFRHQYEDVFLAVAAGVLLLLAIACANVATLLVSRAESREREFAVRLSLGATRGRLARQLFVESLELVAMGAVVGTIVAVLGTSLLVHLLPTSASSLATVIDLRPSAPMLGATAALTVLCTIAISLWPARRAARADLLSALAGARPRIASGWSVDRVLVVVQFALSIVLVCSSALFVATVRNLTRFDGGYRSRNILLAAFEPTACSSHYIVDLRRCHEDTTADARRAAAYTALAREAGRLPGVVGVALTFNAPVWQDVLSQARIRVPGTSAAGEESARITGVSPGYFEATGIGLAAGRDFAESDGANGEPVVIVSQAFERRHFAGRSAVGQSIVVVGRASTAARIVGVARDANFDRLSGAGSDLRHPEQEMLYRPTQQAGRRSGITETLVVRTSRDPGGVASPLRRLAAGISELRLTRLETLGQVFDDATVRERFAAALGSAFGMIALALAAIGTFGVLSYHIAKRTREIGIRVALGARPTDVLRLVVAQAATLCGAGIALGVPLAFGASWATRAQLYSVRAGEPRIFAGGAALLVVVAVIATIIPARRATSVDPMVALRIE